MRKTSDRDLNASINIKNEGSQLIVEEIIKTIHDMDCQGLRWAGIGSKGTVKNLTGLLSFILKKEFIPLIFL